jgi:hypothetical protein
MNKGNAGKGRRKGSTNKVPTALKEMILQALADVGGVDYLKTQAGQNPNAFLALIGRVLPLQLKEGGSDPTVPATTVVHEHHP